MRYPFLSLSLAIASVPLVFGAGWEFVQNGTSGVLALEVIVVSPTLAIFFDRASNDPLMINNHSAWGALWNLQTNTAAPLNVISDTFCGSGGFLSNGTMVREIEHWYFYVTDLVTSSIIGEPCRKCSHQSRLSGRSNGYPTLWPMYWSQWRQLHHLRGSCNATSSRKAMVYYSNQDFWRFHGNLLLISFELIPSISPIFSILQIVVGGIHEATPFYNTDPVNSYEFFPPKDGGVPRPSAFLQRSLPANLFPRQVKFELGCVRNWFPLNRTFALPDGTLLIIANNQTIIYDVENNTETILPEIPNGVRVTNPFDGSAMLLPLSPPNYIPEVLVCGGSNVSDSTPSAHLSSQDPASDQCSRLVITAEGINQGWQVERLLEPRMMSEMILLPNGQILIINGGRTGYAAISSVSHNIAGSNADHPV